MLDHVLPRGSLHTALECMSTGDKEVLRRGRVCASRAPLQLLSSGAKSQPDNNVFSRRRGKSDRAGPAGVGNRLVLCLSADFKGWMLSLQCSFDFCDKEENASNGLLSQHARQNLVQFNN